MRQMLLTSFYNEGNPDSSVLKVTEVVKFSDFQFESELVFSSAEASNLSFQTEGE